MFCYSDQFQDVSDSKGLHERSSIPRKGTDYFFTPQHPYGPRVRRGSHQMCTWALLRCRVAKWTYRAFPIVLCLSTEASFIISTSHVTSRDWLPQYSSAAPRSLSSVHLYWEQTKRLFHLSFSIVSYLLLWNLVDWYRLSFVVVCNRSDGLMLIIVSAVIIDYWHWRFAFTHTQSVIFRLY
jgi:hypothetical protein